MIVHSNDQTRLHCPYEHFVIHWAETTLMSVITARLQPEIKENLAAMAGKPHRSRS